VDRVALIVGALIAGTAAAASPGAATAVQDALDALQALLRARLSDVRTEFTLNRWEENPEQWRRAISELLAETKLDRDTEVVAAAQRIMRLVDPVGAADGNYVVKGAVPPTG
jgi:hypothetical protein